ncbi:MAG: hypothetical protein JXR96_07485 [Deltaproteobacteria bacterium]|nr:hypothetical protein [Deltaproteobacteria bacterium]
MPHRRRPLAFRILLAIAVSALLVPIAAAYVPSAEWLLDKMAYKRSKMGVQRMKIELRCGSAEERQDTEVLYILSPEKVRRELADGTVELCIGGRCRRKTKGGAVEMLPDWTHLQYYYFAHNDARGQRYLALMRGLGVDIKVDTLARIASRIAIVLGAKEWERDRPQIWLDKDLFLPLRLMARDGQSLIQIDWIHWGSQASGDWFPGQLDVYRDGSLIRSCKTAEVEVNKAIPEGLFELK